MHQNKHMNAFLVILLLAFALLAIDTLTHLPTVKVNIEKIQENQ